MESHAFLKASAANVISIIVKLSLLIAEFMLIMFEGHLYHWYHWHVFHHGKKALFLYTYAFASLSRLGCFWSRVADEPYFSEAITYSTIFESIHLLKTKDNSLDEEPVHLHIWRCSLPIVLLFLALPLFVELCQTFSVTDNQLILLFIHSFPKHLCQLLF